MTPPAPRRSSAAASITTPWPRACASIRRARRRCTRASRSPACRARAPAPDVSQIKVERKWYGTDGKEWKPGPLKEGEALIVGVSITADRDMPDALLTDLLPAGLEIENFNLSDAKQWADVVVDGIEITDRANAADVRARGVPRRPLRGRAEAGRGQHRARVLSRARGDAGHLHRAAAAGRGHVPARTCAASASRCRRASRWCSRDRCLHSGIGHAIGQRRRACLTVIAAAQSRNRSDFARTPDEAKLRQTSRLRKIHALIRSAG